MTDLIAVHVSRENNLHLQSLAKKNNCTVDDLINEAVREYYADEIRQADTPQTEVEDGEDYLRGYNDGYYARGVLDKAGVEIHIDKPRGFTLKSISDTPQTDNPCEGCTKHICCGCEHQAEKEAWRKAQADCGWK